MIDEDTGLLQKVKFWLLHRSILMDAVAVDMSRAAKRPKKNSMKGQTELHQPTSESQKIDMFLSCLPASMDSEEYKVY